MKHNLEKVYHWNKWIVNIYDLIRLIMHNHCVNSVRFNWDTWGYVGVYPLRYYFFFISRGYICFKKCGLFFFLSAIHKSMALFISECVYCDAFFSSCFSSPSYLLRISQVVLMVKKNLPANAGDARDVGLIPGPRRSPQEGNDNPL